jgi:transcriptional regulator with XRE-family HTH domain
MTTINHNERCKFAEPMIEKRKKIGLSQQDIADYLGLSRPTIIKIEKGERPLNPVEEQKLRQYFDSFESESSQMRINIPQQKLEKFKQVLLYILEKVGAKPNVGMTVLYKLLYFTDFDYYEKHEDQLMGLTYIKNTHGPTPREFAKVVEQMIKNGEIEKVKSTYFKHQQTKYLPRKKPDLGILNGRELEMIESVLDRYSDKTATDLSEMTHRDMPWMATKDKENIEYELAFYRSDEFSVREYGEL